MTTNTINIRWLHENVDYQKCWLEMRAFTDKRTHETQDEIWLLEHSPVFTQGQNGKAEHLLNPGDIPVVQTDRGGQITYHGPGQLMAYILIDLKRRKLNVRALVTALEQSVIDLLKANNIEAIAKRDAPGVYVDEQKICSIGLRIRHGNSYHGLAFNINMDLEPFSRINPCGFAELKMTHLANLCNINTTKDAGTKLCTHFLKNLGYTNANYYL